MADKVLLRVLGGNSDRSMRYDELAALLTRLGFVLSRSNGSHRTFAFPDGSEALTLVDQPKQVKAWQVRAVRGVILRMQAAREDD